MSQTQQFNAYAHFQFKRDTLENWTNNNPILKAGEPSFVINFSDVLHQLKIGDGVTAWKDLPFFPGDTGGGGSIDPSILDSKMDKFGEVDEYGLNVNLNQEQQTAFHGYEIALHAYKRLLLIGETVTLNNNQLSDVGNPINNTDAANKQYVDNLIGDIETALDNIIEIQNSLIGGEVV